MNSTKSQIAKKNAQNRITRFKIITPKVVLDVMLNMQPLGNKSIALKRALTLKTEGHWNTQSIKSKNINIK